MASTLVSPTMRRTRPFQMKCMLGWAKARSWAMRVARSASRRCTTCTVEAKRARNMPSSTAALPPPITTTSLSR